MKTTAYAILLLVLAIAFFAAPLNAQSKYLYIVAVDSAIAELSAFKQPSGFYDIDKLKSISKPDLDAQSERFQDLKILLDEIGAVSIRKFIRRLPDGIRTLRTRRGTEESVEHLQAATVLVA